MITPRVLVGLLALLALGCDSKPPQNGGAAPKDGVPAKADDAKADDAKADDAKADDAKADDAKADDAKADDAKADDAKADDAKADDAKADDAKADDAKADDANAEPEVRPDLLTFARGVVTVSSTSSGAKKEVTTVEANKIIDGDPSGSVLISSATKDAQATLIYELPAPTVFDAIAVPNVLETPSPSQTFVAEVRVFTSDASSKGPWQSLASGTLKTHDKKGEHTALPLDPKFATAKARWVKVELQGGIDVQREPTFLEFSEIIGHGTQDPVPLREGFGGVWRGKGVKMELSQDGAIVTGCYDGESKLQGTVSGNILRARGQAPKSEVESLFVLVLGEDGSLQGVRSTNGAPFRTYAGSQSKDAKPTCTAPPEPKLGCGSTVYALNFDFNSDKLRPDSAAVIDALAKGLAGEKGIVIEGHTSSEGSTKYNQDLSERRAASVVQAVIAKGIDKGAIKAAGRGESTPIADNATEAGRALNRRVEVVCGG